MDEDELSEAIRLVDDWQDGAPDYLKGSIEILLEAAYRYSEVMD